MTATKLTETKLQPDERKRAAPRGLSHPAIWVRAAIFLCVGAVSACTGVSSNPYSAEGPHAGLVYSPPKADVPLTIAATANGLTVTAGALEYVRDEAYEFQLSHVFSPFHASEIKISAQNGLLSTVDLESDGRLDETLIEAAKSAARVPTFESAMSSPTTIYNEKIVLDDLDEGGPPAVVGVFATSELQSLNDRIRGQLAARGIFGGAFALHVWRETPLAADATAQPPSPDECRVGVCYRLPVAYVVEVTFNGVAQRAKIHAPNGSRIYVSAFDRGFFGKWITKARFENGMLVGYDRTIESSEAETLATLPAATARAFLGELLAASEDQKKLVDAQIALAEAEAKAKELENQNAFESLIGRGAPPTSPALFQFNFGEGGLPQGASEAELMRDRLNTKVEIGVPGSPSVGTDGTASNDGTG